MITEPDALILGKWGGEFSTILARADGEIAIDHSLEAVNDRLFFIRIR